VNFEELKKKYPNHLQVLVKDVDLLNADSNKKIDKYNADVKSTEYGHFLNYIDDEQDSDLSQEHDTKEEGAQVKIGDIEHLLEKIHFNGKLKHLNKNKYSSRLLRPENLVLNQMNQRMIQNLNKNFNEDQREMMLLLKWKTSCSG
jgi:hypothetical protein